MKPEPVLWTCKGCERSAHSSLGPACFCCPLGLLCVKTALRVVYLCLESHWQAHWSATSSNHNQDEGIQLTKKLHWLLNMPQSYRWWEWWPWGREGRRRFAKLLCVMRAPWDFCIRAFYRIFLVQVLTWMFLFILLYWDILQVSHLPWDLPWHNVTWYVLRHDVLYNTTLLYFLPNTYQ